MSEKQYNQFRLSLEKELVDLFGSAVIGSSGAVGTVKGGGIKSVVKESTDGQYTITLEDRFARFLGFSAGVLAATKTSVAAVQVLGTPATFQADVKSTGQIVVQCLDFAGTEVNPPSGSVLSFGITVRRSSVGPYDK